MGSMGLIHHECLKTWFESKKVTRHSHDVTTYFWKHLECELCKTPFPSETRSLDGKKILNIVEYDIPQDDPYYIVLESISSNTSKVVHVISMENIHRLIIGRGHEAHVRVTDISVSRMHAELIKSPQGFYYLTDNNSKFGTLTLVRHPVEIMPNEKTTLQIGRTVFDLEVKYSEKFSLRNCLCGGPKHSKKQNQDERHISVDGLNQFPYCFASQPFLDSLDKRRMSGIRRISRTSQKSKSASSHKHGVQSPQNANQMVPT
jgi:hypothetical protein